MRCFLIMPYRNREADRGHRDELDALHSLIREVAESVEVPGAAGERLRCVRGDADIRPGEIIRGILDDLIHSEIAIAVLTGHNSNVFYELGVRHAVSDNTILLAESEDEVPFDLRPQRMILYSTGLVGVQRLRADLRRALEAIIRAPATAADNPVRRFLVEREHERIMSQGRPPGFDILTELIRDIGALRAEVANQGGQMQEMRAALQTFMTAPPDAAGCAVEDLSCLAGAWLNLESRSHAYAELIGDRMVFLYCYGGDHAPTGTYHDLRRVGDQLFARFEWLDDSAIAGFALLRITGPDSLSGGWWFTNSVPAHVRENLTSLDQSQPGMIPSDWRRLHDHPTPLWAAEWFRQRQLGESGRHNA